MSAIPCPCISAVVGKSQKPPSQLWPSFLKSLLLPIIVLVLFACGPYWLNNKVRAQVIKGLDSSTRLTEAQKRTAIDEMSHVDFAAVCRNRPPEYAGLYSALVKAGVADTYAHLRWGLDASIVLVSLLLTTSVAILALSAAARKSPAALISNFRLGWKIGMASALLQVLVLIPVMTYGAYLFPILWSDSWYPQYVITIAILGLAALVTSIKVLLKKIPLRLDEPLSRHITPEEAPEFWQAVRHASERLGTNPPDNVLVGLDLNFYVTEVDVWDGRELLKGRTLYLSYPLLRQLPEDELLAIIGHELGHFIGNDTRLTREFLPMHLKTGATLASLGKSAYMGWSSFHFLNFFSWCFGQSKQSISREREILADKHAAYLTSPGIAGSALVRFHVLSEAFQQGLIDAVRKGAESPLEVPLYTVVREKLPAGAPFWTELFEKKLSHPLDSHPALDVRLEALGQSIDSNQAAALASQETISAYEKWFANRQELFAEIRQQASAVVEQMRSQAKITDADYQTAEGRALLDGLFPEKKWNIVTSGFWIQEGLLAFFTVGLLVGSLLIFQSDTELALIAIVCVVLACLTAYGFIVTWARHRHGEFTLNAGGVHYTGWKRSLLFQDVMQITGRKVHSKITIIFRLKQPQPSIWKFSLRRFQRKTVSFALHDLTGPSNKAEMIFRYCTRQKAE